jgi:hypothetical protein
MKPSPSCSTGGFSLLRRRSTAYPGIDATNASSPPDPRIVQSPSARSKPVVPASGVPSPFAPTRRWSNWKAGARRVGDGEVGHVPEQSAALGLEDDVLEAVAVARLGEQVAGVVPPLGRDVVRAVVAGERDRDRGVPRRRRGRAGRLGRGQRWRAEGDEDRDEQDRKRKRDI